MTSLLVLLTRSLNHYDATGNPVYDWAVGLLRAGNTVTLRSFGDNFVDAGDFACRLCLFLSVDCQLVLD